MASDKLPAKFNERERYAYKWLFDSGIRPWLVDLVTKEVNTPEGRFSSLITYAEHRGMRYRKKVKR